MQIELTIFYKKVLDPKNLEKIFYMSDRELSKAVALEVNSIY